MIWNFTSDCSEGAVYGCIDALKYLNKNGGTSRPLSKVLENYMNDVGIVDPDGSVLNGLIAGMTSFGFITIPNHNSQAGTITSLGKRLISATTTYEIQQCYLDAIKKIQYQTDSGNMFYPFQWTIDIFLEMAQRGEEPSLKRSEFAFFVQTSSPYYGVQRAVDDILKSRIPNQESMPNSNETLFIFADLNIRCLRATGQFRKKGRGLEIVSII